jgi:hypothetical protein
MVLEISLHSLVCAANSRSFPGFSRTVFEFEEYLVLNQPDLEFLTASNSVLVERQQFAKERAAQAEHNKLRAKQEEQEYKQSIHSRIADAEKDREVVYGEHKK